MPTGGQVTLCQVVALLEHAHLKSAVTAVRADTGIYLQPLVQAKCKLLETAPGVPDHTALHKRILYLNSVQNGACMSDITAYRHTGAHI